MKYDPAEWNCSEVFHTICQIYWKTIGKNWNSNFPAKTPRSSAVYINYDSIPLGHWGWSTISLFLPYFYVSWLTYGLIELIIAFLNTVTMVRKSKQNYHA